MNESASHQPVVHDPVVITSNQNSFELVALPAASLAVPEDKQVSDCEWVSFFRIHGRVPMLGDDKKPWEYSGWLLYYRMLLEEHPAIPKRWEYWCRAMSAGRLLNDAIPQIKFAECRAPEAIKLVDRWIRLVCHHEHSSSAMDKLADWFLWGFGLSKDRPDLSLELNERLYREVNLGPLLLQPCDCLGEWVAVQKGSWNPHAFFPTPHSVVEMMIRVTLDDDNGDLRSKSVCDPCVGSGRMLLHASNHSLRLYGMDVDPLMVKICNINGALFAPWIVRPFPESFFRGC